MGKYIIDVGALERGSPATLKISCFLWIANELAEANRLKRLEMVENQPSVNPEIAKQFKKSGFEEKLEDQA